jgi:hypothetical protein
MHRFLPQALSVLLALMPVWSEAQTPAAAQAPAAQTPAAPAPAPEASSPAAAPTIESLKVIPLAGKGEVNDIKRKLMAPLVVEVDDREDRPIEGAEVIFRFPLRGASATFPGGKTSQTTRTNAQGQAAAMNWTANNENGSFEVHVSASYGNQIGQTSFSMSNSNSVPEGRHNGDFAARAKSDHWYSPLWVKLAIGAVAAGAITGIVLATGGGSSGSKPTPPITITPGTPTIGR